MKRELQIDESVTFADYTITAMIDHEGVAIVRVESDKGNMVIRENTSTNSFDLCSYQLSNISKPETAKNDITLGDSLTFGNCIVIPWIDNWENPILRVQAEKGRMVIRHDGSTKIFDLYTSKL